MEQELARCFPEQRFGGDVRHLEHHLSHLGSAYLVSPFRDCLAVSVDGFGDFASTSWGVGRDGEVGIDGQIFFPHSLGIFYETITRHLGFPDYGDEYKVMGLASYGVPRYLAEMRQIVMLQNDGQFRLNLDYFRHHREYVSYDWENGQPALENLASRSLAALLGPARKNNEEISEHHRDIARSAQSMYEEALFHLLNRLHERYRIDALALAGGCAMNSVANGKIYRNTPFRRLYVPPAAGDAGGAVGAAFLAWQNVSTGSPVTNFKMDHAYWGPEFSDEDIGALLLSRGSDLKALLCSVEQIRDEGGLCELTARAIADGKVVGWFQGRMEWGPRALGNRSIICDPRRADVKELLNTKIKRRESFRPFAPTILREAVAEWFEEDDDVPFMTQAYPIRAKKRALIPAVTHIDGSGRLQTVTRDANPLYYRLIEAFRELTGVPMVLNTSFNENEPVVCKPEEALDCFLRTKMDVLVMGNYVISRNSAI